MRMASIIAVFLAVGFAVAAETPDQGDIQKQIYFGSEVPPDRSAAYLAERKIVHSLNINIGMRSAVIEGCGLYGLSQLRVSPLDFSDTTGNVILDMAIQRELGILMSAFSVNPRFVMINDRGSPNAMATLDVLDGSFPQGTVLFGIGLMQLEMMQSASGMGFSVAAIMAHEYAHIYQGHSGNQMPVRDRELQADFLAGWYLAGRQSLLPTDPREAFLSFFSKGDYAFNSQGHHGTPGQRSYMIMGGYTFGLQAQRLGRPATTADAYNAAIAALNGLPNI